jgi:succinate dehydrogenase/fumarate reductase cytochrome b subunit
MLHKLQNRIITMSVQVEGIFGFLLLVIDIWAIVRIVQSNASTGKKVLWIVLILLLPLLGVILWWFLGPKG